MLMEQAAMLLLVMGPDMSVGDQPVAVVDAVLPATAKADFKSADVCLDLFHFDAPVPFQLVF